ncbi:hypothetical protein EH164_21265 [Kosakonia sp. CCTCC M2018092]|nr:hypothetical protein EH164_21265 [Kosakonia sp. CCTCC M2018092]
MERRGRCACPAYKHTPVGRIRRLRRHPARNAGGAALARPTKHAPVGRIRRLRRHLARNAGGAALARPTNTLT